MGGNAQAGQLHAEMAQGENAASEQTGVAGVIEKAKALAGQAVGFVKDWLYEGVETKSAQQATGSLVEVETGMQNDDYAEILSGLSEGDVILYTAAEETNSFMSMMGGMMGGMGGMGGGPR